jgi:hypothetical protein
VTVLLISSDEFGFASNHLTTPQALRRSSQCFTDSFGSRESRCLQYVEMALRLGIESK